MEKHQLKKELDRYIKDCLAKGYKLEEIKNALLASGYSRHGYDKLILDEAVNKHSVKVNFSLFFILAVIVIIAGFFFIKPVITGYIVVDKAVNYNDTVGISFDESSGYTWLVENPGDLSSIKLSGSVTSEGSARVYVEHNNERYLIFDSDSLKETGLGFITGFAVLNETAEEATNETQIIDDEADENKTSKEEKDKPNAPPVWKSDVDEFVIAGITVIDLNNYFSDKNNDTISYEATTPEKISVETDNNLVTLIPAGYNFNTTITFSATDGDKTTKKEITLLVPERKITIDLRYNSGTEFDIGDDGIESLTGVIDFGVDALFDWDVDYGKLCTRWETYSLDSNEVTTICNGNEECCGFINLIPTDNYWDSVFYSNYEKYGATFENIISAQVIYYDVDLAVPKADIFYSEFANLTARFYPDVISFENICLESCLLTGFDEESYKLVIELTNATLTLDSIGYSVLEEAVNIPPRLVKPVPDIVINKNEYFFINLSEYFTDDDSLIYSSDVVDNIGISVENDLFTLIPSLNFTGSREITFTADDGYNITSVKVNIDVVSINNRPNCSLIPDLTIGVSSSLELDLDLYCSDPDNDKLVYSYYKTSNISVVVDENIARLIPDKGFTGTRHMFFVANDSESIVATNVFKIDVSVPMEKFVIRNAAGDNIASISSEGSMFIKGALHENAFLTFSPGSFIIRDQHDDNVAVINNSGLFLKSVVNENADMNLAEGYNFEIRGLDNELIAFFDDQGNLFLKGSLRENYENP